MMRSLCLRFIGCSILLAWASTAPAQTSADDGRAEAETLFREGRELMEAGKVQEACLKFERSQQLVRAAGTLLNLAICHEDQGKLATAWVEYEESLDRALQAETASRAEFIRGRMARLLGRVPRLTIVVPDALRSAGVKVFRGQEEVPRERWGGSVAVDPGEYQIRATADGRVPWSKSVSVREGQEVSIEVPLLEEARTSPPAAPASEPVAVNPTASPGLPARDGEPSHESVRTAAWVGGATGVALVGAGAYFGVRALSKRSDSDAYCHDDGFCQQQGVDLNTEAYDNARWSNVLIGSGLVLTGVSAMLLLQFPASDSPDSATQSRGTPTPRRVRIAAHPGGIDAAVTW